MLNNVILLFFISFPFVCEYVIGYMFSVPGIETYIGDWNYFSIIVLILKVELFYLPFILFDKKTKVLIYAYIAIGYIPALINCMHMLILRSVLSSCSIYVILNSNINEICEFIEHAWSYKTLAVMTLFTAVSVMFVRFNKIKFECKKTYIQNDKLLIACCMSSYIYIFFCGEDQNLNCFRIVKAVYEYVIEQRKYEKVLNTHIDYGEVKSRINSDKNQTYIVIFGESVDKKHMGLYGYYRDTTPYFDEIKDELKVFKNVKSGFASTLESLRGGVTFHRDIKNGNIISFLNHAQFKTYWLSNQFAIGGYDTLFGIIAKLTNGFSIFVNTCMPLLGHINAYDEALISKIKRALDDYSNKKVIFVHLFGSHVYYKHRYPDTFNCFCNSTMTARQQSVACYDNSIRYTDYVLRQILDLLKTRKNEVSCMLYFSDHGEDCYDEPESIHCHCESATRLHSYDIPMIVWASDEYKKLVNVDAWDTDKKYVTTDMIYSILDLIGLEGEYIDRKKSLFYTENQ